MNRIIYLLIIFFSSINFCFPQTPESLLRSSFEIKSIDPNDEDFTDLLPLRKKIDEAQIVVLGEISHNDGATLQAKARLVKCLHKEMNFEVLAWEAGFIDCYNMNSALKLKLTLNDVKKYMMSSEWEASEYVDPIFGYARESLKKEKPLILAGFDFGKSLKTAKNYMEVFDSIFAKAPGLRPTDSLYSIIDIFTKAVGGYLGSKLSKKISRKSEQAIKYFIYTLIDSINLEKKYSEIFSQVDKLKYSYFLRSFYFDIELYDLIYQNDESYQTMRNKFMADRILWLIEKFYPNKKIIIWAKTTHFRRNTFLQKRLEDDLTFFDKSALVLQAGDYLDYYLDKKIYTIAFTTFQGERGIIFPEDQPKKKDYEYTENIQEPEADSYEAIAHETKKEYLFTDLRSLRKNNWLTKENSAYPFGHRKVIARWSKLIDAFFFIDKMFPNKILPIYK